MDKYVVIALSSTAVPGNFGAKTKHIDLYSASSTRLSTWHCPHLLHAERRAAALCCGAVAAGRSPLSIAISCLQRAQQQTTTAVVFCTLFFFQQCGGQMPKVHETTTFLLVTAKYSPIKKFHSQTQQ